MLYGEKNKPRELSDAEISLAQLRNTNELLYQ